MTAKPSELAQVPRRRRIRRAQATDAAAIAALVDSAEALRQVSPLEVFPLDQATVLHWLMQRDAGHVLEDRGEIQAYGELVPDARSSDRVWIGHMIVHPRRRGLGIGQRLVQELLRVAEHERGAREVARTVTPGACRTNAAASVAHGASTCSQLSNTSSNCLFLTLSGSCWLAGRPFVPT